MCVYIYILHTQVLPSLSLSLYVHIYIYIYIYMYIGSNTHKLLPASVGEQNTPPKKLTRGMVSFRSTKSAAGEQHLLQDCSNIVPLRIYSCCFASNETSKCTFMKRLTDNPMNETCPPFGGGLRRSPRRREAHEI